MGDQRELTHDDLDAAVGTPQETSVKLDFTLQAYGRLERKHGELKRDLARVREERDQLQEALDDLDAYHRAQGGALLQRVREERDEARAWIGLAVAVVPIESLTRINEDYAKVTRAALASLGEQNG